MLCVCICVHVHAIALCQINKMNSAAPFVRGNDRERVIWDTPHSPCHSVNSTADHPNDPRRQTAGRVVLLCVMCVCVDVMQYQSHSPQPFVQGNDREILGDGDIFEGHSTLPLS